MEKNCNCTGDCENVVTTVKGVNKFGSKSSIGVFPRNNEVIVKIEMIVPIMSIVSGKLPTDSDIVNKPIITVAAIGPKVDGLEIGDKILLNIESNYIVVDVETNEQSFKKLTTLYKGLKGEELNTIYKSDKNKVTVIQYGIFPEFLIKAIL